MKWIKYLLKPFFSLLIRKNYFPDVRGGVHGFGVPPENRAQDRPQARPGNRFFGGHTWGQGHVLGRE